MTKLPIPFPKNPSLGNNQLIIEKSIKIKKAGNNGTLISFILDESGSMASCYNETVAGYNEYIKGQRNQEGKCFVSLTKFEGGKTTNLYENLDINEVPDLGRNNYNPAGGTNLLDAIGSTILNVDSKLKTMKKKDRPSVLIIIMTDGEENCSRKFNNNQIKELIKSCEKSNYTFMFLGANIDSFAVASSYGLSAGSTASYSTSNMSATMDVVGAATTRYRALRAMGMSSADITTQGLYTTEERNKIL